MTLISRMFGRLAYRRGNIRNGLYPSCGPWAEMVQAQNHLMAYRGHREVYRRAWELGDFSGVVGTTTVGRFRFRSGYGASTLTYVAMIGLDDHRTTAASDPILQFETTISGGATSTSTMHYGLSQSSSGIDSPNEIILATSDVAITPNTVYEVAIKTVGGAGAGARPIAICAYEQASPLTINEAVNYWNTMSITAATPIYDADRQQLLVGLNAMWKRNRAPCWHWHRESGQARTRSSATYINIIDNATTGTPATSDYGFYLDLTGHNTFSATTVPMELAVYAEDAAQVRLIDSAGNTYGPTAAAGASAGWVTVAVNLPTASTFYTAQYAGDGATLGSVYAISLISYTP